LEQIVHRRTFVISRLNRLCVTIVHAANAIAAFVESAFRSDDSPFGSLDDMVAAPGFSEVSNFAQRRFPVVESTDRHYEYLVARDEIMTQLLKVMSDHELDAIVYKAVEHQPTLIEDGVNPPYVNTKGVPYLNTFLVYVPAIVVPAGFTTDALPVGITFMGRPYDDGTMLRLAYSYEQATHHRRPADTVPELSDD